MAVDPQRQGGSERPEESELVRAVTAARVGGFVWNWRSNEVQWSAELCRLHGITLRDFGGRIEDFLAFVHAEDRPFVESMVENALKDPGPFVLDYRIVRADGVERTLHSQGGVETDDDDQPTRIVGACWDVTERVAAQHKLERSMSLLCATLDASANGVLVVDTEQRVVLCNRQFLEMWRIPPELAVGPTDGQMLGYVGDQLVDPDAFIRKVQELYDQPEAESRDVLRFRDGRTFERISKPQLLGDQIVGRVWSFLDVTEREEALRAREVFLATAAHEIRGPLMSMRLVVQALQDEVLSPDEMPRLLEIADRETTRLSQFVDQLLDVGRLRAKKLELDLERVDLVEAVEEVVSRLAHEIERSGSQVTVEADGRPSVWADRLRLSQIVTNLLTNALKFGRRGPVTLSIEQRAETASLTVTDRGIGMTPEEVDRIFEPFERRVSERHYGGLGLGLHIVQSLAVAMGGDVHVTSEPEEGSTFIVTLPRVAS